MQTYSCNCAYIAVSRRQGSNKRRNEVEKGSNLPSLLFSYIIDFFGIKHVMIWYASDCSVINLDA